MRKLMTAERANQLARVLQTVCMLMVALAVLIAVSVLFGRVKVAMNTPEGYYENALLLEEDHNVDFRFLYAGLSDLNIHLDTTATQGEVNIMTYLGIVVMSFSVLIPGAYAFFVMALFFGKIAKGEVFTTSNASLLLRGGTVLLICTILTPIFNVYIIPELINKFTSNVISTGVGMNFMQLFAGAILLVMAYVFHYGIYLQDEADHTL